MLVISHDDGSSRMHLQDGHSALRRTFFTVAVVHNVQGDILHYRADCSGDIPYRGGGLHSATVYVWRTDKGLVIGL